MNSPEPGKEVAEPNAIPVGSLPWSISAGFIAHGQGQDEAYGAWWQQHRAVVTAYPAIGRHGSPAQAKFLDLYAVFHGGWVDLMALADLVMLYAPSETDG